MKAAALLTISVLFLISCSNESSDLPSPEDFGKTVYQTLQQDNFNAFAGLIAGKEQYELAIEASNISDSLKQEYLDTIRVLWDGVDLRSQYLEAFKNVRNTAISMELDWNAAQVDSVAHTDTFDEELSAIFDNVADLRVYVSTGKAQYTISLNNVVCSASRWMMTDAPAIGAH